MRTKNETDTVNTETGEISAKTNFNNWINSAARESTFRLYQMVRDNEMTPLLLRAALQEAYTQGSIQTRADIIESLLTPAEPAPLPCDDAGVMAGSVADTKAALPANLTAGDAA